MSVWFAYRCHYGLPTTRVVKRFDEPNLVAWFRKHCPPIADEDQATDHVRRTFGFDPGYLALFLTDYAASGRPPPQNDKELRALLRTWSVQGGIVFQPGSIQILDDDDEAEFAIYVFDDTFASKYPERTAWLTLEDWLLPVEAGTGEFRPLFRTRRLGPRGRWAGTTYVVIFEATHSLNLTDLDLADRLEGVRLPQLARYLTAVPEEVREDRDWPGELETLADELLAGRPASATERAFLRTLREAPGDEGPWEVYGDWLEEQGRPRADLCLLERALGRVSKRECRSKHSQWQVAPHVAQLCLHTHNYLRIRHFHHWVLFDDLWASAHSDLANSLLRQVERWDALSDPRRRRTE